MWQLTRGKFQLEVGVDVDLGCAVPYVVLWTEFPQLTDKQPAPSVSLFITNSLKQEGSPISGDLRLILNA